MMTNSIVLCARIESTPGRVAVRRFAKGLVLSVLLMLLAACQASSPIIEAPESEDATSIGSAGVGDRLYPHLGNGGYDVQHYALDMTVDVEANVLEASATIDAVTIQPLSRFNLDFAGLTIDALSVNGVASEFERQETELIVTPAMPLGEGEAFQVTVSYHGTPIPLADTSVGIDSLGWQPQPGGIFAASEPNGSMNWYPVNNHPSDKATYTFRVTVPTDYQVAMNGLLLDELAAELNGNEAVTYVWDVAFPMASYLATIHIGDYEIETQMTPEGVLLRNYFPVDTPDSVKDDFAITPAMLTYMTETVADYPFEVYGVVLLTVEVPWALETQTLSIFPPSGADERTVMHELAHQWFGNDVSPAMWEDIWLNEGFASYFHFLWVEEQEGRASFTRVMDNLYSQLTFAGAGSPIPSTSRDLFSRAVYFRGAWTLHALRLSVGDEQFFDIVRTYYAQYAGGSASTLDFLTVVEESAGGEARALVEAWLYDETVPPHPSEQQ